MSDYHLFRTFTAQKMKFPAGLVSFTGEILNGKLHLLSSVCVDKGFLETIMELIKNNYCNRDNIIHSIAFIHSFIQSSLCQFPSEWVNEAAWFDWNCLETNLYFWRAYRNSWTLDARVGRWTLDAELWMLDSGCWTLDVGLWTLDSGRWTLNPGRWTLDAGLRTLNARMWMLKF